MRVHTAKSVSAAPHSVRISFPKLGDGVAVRISLIYPVMSGKFIVCVDDLFGGGKSDRISDLLRLDINLEEVVRRLVLSRVFYAALNSDDTKVHYSKAMRVVNSGGDPYDNSLFSESTSSLYLRSAAIRKIDFPLVEFGFTQMFWTEFGSIYEWPKRNANYRPELWSKLESVLLSE